jgi:hypothetical protein
VLDGIRDEDLLAVEPSFEDGTVEHFSRRCNEGMSGKIFADVSARICSAQTIA